MPLKELQLTNFKAFSTPDPIPIRPITLIFGPNSSGKSSIIQSLLLLKQTLQDENPNTVLSPKGNEVDLGSFYEFVHRHETEREVSFKIGTECGDLKITFSYDEAAKRIQCSSLGLFVRDENDAIITFKPDETQRLSTFTVDRINERHGWWEDIWKNKIDKIRKCLLSEVDEQVNELRKEFKKPDEESLKEYLKKESSRIKEENKISEEESKKKRLVNTKLEFSLYGKDYTDHLALLEIKEYLNSYSINNFVNEFRETAVNLKMSRFLPISHNGFDENVRFEDVNVKEALEYLLVFSKLKKPKLNRGFNILKYGLNWFLEDAFGETRKLSPEGKMLCSFLPAEIVLKVSEVLRKELSEIIYIGPLRKEPERYYIHRGNKVERVGKSGTLTADLLLQDKEVLARTNEFFNKLKYELKVSPLKSDDGEVQDVYAIRLVNMETNTHANITDVGFGISQVLPVVVQSAVSQNATICIEQPELHLHPGAQKELGDLFIESALGERKNTFIIETHSEHIILRILRRIRETSVGNIENRTPIRPEDVSVIYAKPTSRGTKVYSLEITEDGDFVGEWPGGFFTERVEELF